MVGRRYEWSWLYAAIEPDTGGDLCRYLSALDGVRFEVSLQRLGERFCGGVIDHWRALDEVELTAGEEQGRPRVKVTTVRAMLEQAGLAP